MIKKLIYIIFYDLKSKRDPLRIFKKSYARYQRLGYEGMINRLEKEYSLVDSTYYMTLADNKKAYALWMKYQKEREVSRELLTYTPLISVIIPTYNTPPHYLKACIESVLSQIYKNFEICIADDASSNQETLEVLKEYEKKDERIKIVYREENGHVSEASNSALSLASGVFVAFLDHDDMLAPEALYQMVKRVNEKPHLKLLYSDEDKIDAKNQRYDPHFKSGWNPDMFFSQNYLSHLTLIQKALIDTIGGFRKGYEGSQDYDLYLRCLHHIEESEIDHVEHILYHWRAIDGSTALCAHEKRYTMTSGLKALEDYFNTQGQKVTIEKGMVDNTYKVSYPITGTPPLVSIVIPTRDRHDLLHKCIDSILKFTEYENYEILIVDNESSEAQTLLYFEELKKYQNIKIIEYHYPFNFSAINNFGVDHAQGEVVVLLNNDVEIISKHWLTEMVEHALRPEIGAVGAMLYYDDDRIQHAGVILGIGGVAGHSHKYFSKGMFGYFSRLKIIQNYAAVTGACLAVKKSLYEAVGGLDQENLSVAFNDVDFCLKLQEKGYRNLWTPYVELYHHESKSRGLEDTDEKQERFQQEVAYMKRRWGKKLMRDPYYNSHLTRKYENFMIHFPLEK